MFKGKKKLNKVIFIKMLNESYEKWVKKILSLLHQRAFLMRHFWLPSSMLRHTGRFGLSFYHTSKFSHAKFIKIGGNHSKKQSLDHLILKMKKNPHFFTQGLLSWVLWFQNHCQGIFLDCLYHIWAPINSSWIMITSNINLELSIKS